MSTPRAPWVCGDWMKARCVRGGILLVHEALDRRLEVPSHPRLAAIFASRGPTWFEPNGGLPDPCDGLLDEHASACAGLRARSRPAASAQRRRSPARGAQLPKWHCR